MLRRIIKINPEKCDGCGLCVTACHEGAIGLRDGKAVLLRDDYCDGLGDCLPACPTGAITFEEREAAAFDAEAVKAKMAAKGNSGGCPGSQMHSFAPEENPPSLPTRSAPRSNPSELRQWPVQIQLVPVNAPYFNDSDLLVAADCAAYAHGDFHRQFMHGKVTLIGCPKLDAVEYSEKLTAILKNNTIRSVTVARMEVPCCGGLQQAVMSALQNCGKTIPYQVVQLKIQN